MELMFQLSLYKNKKKIKEKNMKRPNGYWNKERVFAEGQKYKTKKEFEKGCRTAYQVALKNGWLKEMTWFTRPTVYNKKWTKENVFAEARKYETRSDFAKGCPKAYNVAIKNKWLSEMTWFENGYILRWEKRKSVA